MMEKLMLAEFKLPGGATVYVEAAEIPQDIRETRAGVRSETLSWLKRDEKEGPADLKERLAPLAQALSAMRGTLTYAIDELDEMTLEVGIKFMGPRGVVLSQANGEATVKVIMKWRANNKP